MEAGPVEPSDGSDRIAKPITITASPDSLPSNPPLPRAGGPRIGVAISSQPSADEVIAEKMTGSHIAKLIENSARSDRQVWIDGLVERVQVTILLLAVLILIGLICDWTIKAQQYQMTEKFIIAFLGFVGGFGIGGANERRKKKKSE